MIIKIFVPRNTWLRCFVFIIVGFVGLSDCWLLTIYLGIVGFCDRRSQLSMYVSWNSDRPTDRPATIHVDISCNAPCNAPMVGVPAGVGRVWNSVYHRFSTRWVDWRNSQPLRRSLHTPTGKHPSVTHLSRSSRRSLLKEEPPWSGTAICQ